MIVRVRAEPLWKISVRVLADLLMFVGLAGMVVWIWWIADGAVYQYTQGIQFESAVEHKLPQAIENDTAPAPRIQIARLLAPALPKPDPLVLGRLEIPSVHLSVMLREGVDEASLRRAAGHLPASALPGESGNVILLGHRDTFFRPLRGITQGDSLRVKTRTASFDYVVDSIQVVDPEQTLAFRDDPEAKSMTLITCFPFDYVGPAPRRFIVRARLRVSDLDSAVQSDITKSNSPEKLK